MSSEIMVLSGYGINMRVRSGGLAIKSGFLFMGNLQKTFISRGLNEVEHIVIIAQSGNLSIDVVKWLMSQNIAVSFLDEYGDLVTDFMPENHISGITKRRQATADADTKIKISAWLLAEKFKGQRNTLDYISRRYIRARWWSERWSIQIERAIMLSQERERGLSACSDTDSQRILEAQAAAATGNAWREFRSIG